MASEYPGLEHIRIGASAETQYLLDIIDKQHQRLEEARELLDVLASESYHDKPLPHEEDGNCRFCNQPRDPDEEVHIANRPDCYVVRTIVWLRTPTS